MTIIGIRRSVFALILLAGLGSGIMLLACTGDAERIREANKAATNSSSSSSTQMTGEISVFDVRDGDCFNAKRTIGTNSEDFMNVELVPCSGNWVYRALNSFVVDRDGEYPGEAYFEREADRRCNPLANFILFPWPDSWELGDRSVSCLIES